jgi:hypothetical protein
MKSESKGKNLEGVSGWLFVFVIICAVNIILNSLNIFNILVIIGEYGILEGTIDILTQIIGIVLFAITMEMIYSNKKVAVYFGLIAVWYGLFTTLFSWGVYLIFENTEIAISSRFIMLCIKNIIFALIWSVYLVNSDRVKRTLVK